MQRWLRQIGPLYRIERELRDSRTVATLRAVAHAHQARPFTNGSIASLSNSSVSAATCLAAGLAVIIDKCVKMEHGRYRGGLHCAGMNTEIISARKRQR